MRKTNLPIPLSKPNLLAAKAAGILGGEAAYWDVFDKIQETLFVHNKDIEDESVLADIVTSWIRC